MSSKFGVNATISARAARVIAVNSTTTIGIVGVVNEFEPDLYFYGSVSKALAALKDTKGSIYPSLQLIEFQSVETPVILSTVKDNDEEAALKTSILLAVDKFKEAKAVTNYKPDLLIAPTFSHDKDVRAKLIAVAERLKSTTILDSKALTETEVIKNVEDISSKRAIVCNPEISVYDVSTSANINMPLSSIIAAVIARTDGESEYGFSDSYSNRVVQGVTGLSRVVDFELGEDSEADRLRAHNITTVIRYDGFRLWGAETFADDEIWRDLARVRTFDRISEAAQKGVFFAIDKKADQLFYAKKSVEEFLRSLTGAKVLLGYTVTWDEEQNSSTAISSGKFYLNIETQNNPITKRLELDFAYVDNYGDVLMDELKK